MPAYGGAYSSGYSGALVSYRQGAALLIPVGDSTIATSTTNDPLSTWKTDPWAWAQVLSGGRFRYLRNAGVGGDGHASIRARLDSVLAYTPSIVPVTCGINDAVNGVGLPAYAAGIDDIVKRIRASGAVAVLTNVAPNLNTGATLQRIASYNEWLALYAARNGVPLIDWHSALVDPATGAYLAAYTDDGTHQNEAGAKVIGAVSATAIQSIIPNWSIPLLDYNTTDARSIFSNGLFVAGAGLSTGWTTLGAGTFSKSSATIGNWQRVTDAGTGTFGFYSQVSTGYSVGDTLRLSGRLNVVNGTSVGRTQLFLRFVTSEVTCYVLRDATLDRSGVFEVLATVPAATTAVQMQLARVVTTGGTGYAEVSQVSLMNLTAMGVA